MQATVNVNGRITDAQDAVVSVFDHGFLFGEGVYETLRTYNGRPFLLERHLHRLRASATAISLELPLDDSAFTARIDETVGASGIGHERYVRLLLTRGIGDLSYDPAACPTPTVIVIVKSHVETSEAERTAGVAVVLSPVLRNHPGAVSPLIKSNNLLNNALAMQDAIRRGATEAIMRNHRGEISECAQSNLFLVRAGEVVTPSLAAGLLEGVTRNFVLEVGRGLGIPVTDVVLHEADLASADEVFLTSTTREVLPVTRIDDRPVGTGTAGPITRRLAEAFRRRANELSRD
jgi:branched-chain amino acid aminotransferase